MQREVNLSNTCLDLFHCALCSRVLRSPIQCLECGSLYCNSCINTYWTQNEICPNRCTHCNFDYLGPAFDRIMDCISIKCKDFRCGKLVALSQLESHERNCAWLTEANDKSIDVEMIKKQRDLEWMQALGANFLGKVWYPPPRPCFTPKSNGSFLF